MEELEVPSQRKLNSAKRQLKQQYENHMLVLAYPCSVESGIDLADYCLDLYRRALQPNASVTFLDHLCDKLKCEPSDLKSEKDVKDRAKHMVETMWKSTKAIDETSMQNDFDMVKSLKFPTMSLNSQVITEFGIEHITHIRAILRHPRSLTILFIVGHGLSEGMAKILCDNPASNETKKSPCWQWPLYNCEETLELSPEKVTRAAAKGDVVVFSSGLLSPDWVVQQLRMRDRQSDKDNTIVIIIDSCYSGVWKEKISASLCTDRLSRTRVLVQTSSHSDEPSYGATFIPAFDALQHNDLRHINQGNYQQQRRIQKPLFYDSKLEHEHDKLPVVDCNGHHIRFYNGPAIFNADRNARSRSSILEELH